MSASRADFGVALLAASENARFAIARRDAVAASNDISDALTDSAQMLDRASPLFGAETPNAGQNNPRVMTKYQVQVALLSAQTAILNGRFGAAERALRSIEDGAAKDRVPADLPIVEADESLLRARTDLHEGKRGADLTTQLLNAQFALARSKANVQSARALAARIGLRTRARSAAHPLRWRQIVKWRGEIASWSSRSGA